MFFRLPGPTKKSGRRGCQPKLLPELIFGWCFELLFSILSPRRPGFELFRKVQHNRLAPGVFRPRPFGGHAVPDDGGITHRSPCRCDH